MDEQDDRDVSPDQTLLLQIFGDKQPQQTTIILQTWQKCVFRADFDQSLTGLPSVFVRLEEPGDAAEPGGSPPLSLAAVAAMQDIARTCIPDLVPKILRVGEKDADLVSDAKGRKFQFSVVESVEGDTLEDVWDVMSLSNQRAVASSIVNAMKRLQTIRFHTESVQSILSKYGHTYPGATKTTMGGPATGYLKDGNALLAALDRKWSLSKRPVYTTEKSSTEDPYAYMVTSAVKNIPPVAVSEADVTAWPAEAVFCHNDLSPRNLILRKSTTSGTANASCSWYDLVGIIDWELAGFYPPAFELYLQDTYLGTSNHHASFYLLIREELSAQSLLQRTLSQTTLLSIMTLMFTSQHRVLYDGGNIPAHIRQRFYDRLRISRHPDPFLGWRAYPTLSKDEMDALETEVIRDIRGL